MQLVTRLVGRGPSKLTRFFINSGVALLHLSAVGGGAALSRALVNRYPLLGWIGIALMALFCWPRWPWPGANTGPGRVSRHRRHQPRCGGGAGLGRSEIGAHVVVKRLERSIAAPGNEWGLDRCATARRCL
jgi:putative membrane protein